MECVQIELNNVCRTCKNESPEMKSLYYRDSEIDKKNPRLDEMLMACASVQINNEDSLPKSICRSCLVQLKNAYSFKEQCERTDSFWRDYLKNLKTKTIKQEIIDPEFSSDFTGEDSSRSNDIGQINDDESIRNIKEDPESHSRETSKKDVDYVQIVDNNLTIYECRTCSKVFYTLEGLRSHKRIHTNNIEEHYIEMNYDDNIITYSNKLQSGSGDDLVGDEFMEPEVELSENNDQKKIDEIARIANDICDESDTSTNPETLPTKQIPPKIKRSRGKPQEHPVSLKPTGRPRGRPPLMKLKAKLPKIEIDNFPCPQCKEIFPKMRLLEKHAEQHEGLRIHECDSCNKKFTRWNDLKRHKLSHVDVKPFLCMTCNKCFSRRDHLQRHMKLHLNSHSCDLCKAVFSRPENLAKHKDSKHNMGEKKKFMCSECGKAFIRNDFLVIHMRRHRGEKPFKCKYCVKGFARSTDLIVHERYHTGEKTHLCVTCGRGFGRAYDLTVHTRTHTGEKPYRCTYCESAFAQVTDLKAHVRRHTGERFQCELCPKTFIMRYLLTQHKRVVHGLTIVGNERRLQPINKLNLDDPRPVAVSDPLELEQEKVSKSKQEQKK